MTDSEKLLLIRELSMSDVYSILGKETDYAKMSRYIVLGVINDIVYNIEQKAYFKDDKIVFGEEDGDICKEVK